MKIRPLLRPLLPAFLILVLNVLVSAATLAQDTAKVSEAETKAEKAVEAAATANEKMVAAEAFLKKYPKSSLRQHVANLIADQVFAEKDANQRLALSQKALTVFTAESEVAIFKPALIDTYVTLTRFDEAFAEGASLLAKNPENIQILVDLAIAGTEQAKQGNSKYVVPARQYGTKAIELLEADKKPAEMDTTVWDRFKRMLPQIYQEMAIISLMQQDSKDALGKLEKAVKLSPADPFNYLLLASVANDDYQKEAETYKGMPDGKTKDEQLAKVNQLMDKVIDLYAHAAALSEGKAGYEKLHDQVLLDMTPYYKYRHRNSTDDMQKLIDSYKLP